MLDLFLELAAIPSPSGREQAVGEHASRFLRDLGLAVEEDEAGAQIGSDSGNLVCRLPATAPGLPIFLCAHLDTVPPQGPLEPVVEDGIVRNAGGTILGADNKAAVAAMLEAVRRVVVERRPHAGLELLLTLQEELSLGGARVLDLDRIEARTGFVFDQAAPIGEIIVGAPHQKGIDLVFHGRAAHAGIVPELGRSAIVAAARAVADLRLGRLDAETTANVGLVSGGTAANVVPERCSLRIDVRSHDEAKLAALVQEILDTATFAANQTECTLDAHVFETVPGYRFTPDVEAVRMAQAALGRAGYEASLTRTGGGADSNVFNRRGCQCVTLSNGMAEIHTPHEHIAVADLEGMVEVTLALLDVAREGL